MLIHPGITAHENDLAISFQDLYEKNKKKRGPSQMTLSELLQTQVDNSMDKEQLSALKTETNKRFSFSLASFAFCLIAVPLAITAHRKETSIGFLFSLIVAFVYFFFIVMVDTVRSNPKFHPELLIWLPNVVFISLGSRSLLPHEPPLTEADRPVSLALSINDEFLPPVPHFRLL